MRPGLLSCLVPGNTLVQEEEVSCSRAEQGTGAALTCAVDRGLPGACGQFTYSPLT